MKKGIFGILVLMILCAASFAFATTNNNTVILPPIQIGINDSTINTINKSNTAVEIPVISSSPYVEATQNELEQMNKECCGPGCKILKYIKYVGAQTAYEKLTGNTYEERLYAQQQQDYQDIVDRCGAQPMNPSTNEESNYCRLMKTFCNNDEDFLTKINCVCGPNKIKRINLGKAYCENYGAQKVEKVSDEESAVVKLNTTIAGGYGGSGGLATPEQQ